MAQSPRLGVIMLDTRFERPVGDIGNPASFRFPVAYRVIPGASAARAVRGDPSAFLPAFIEAGRALAAEGATLIATSCGFLSMFQRDLDAALPVPVLTSALLHHARIEAGLGPGEACGIMTIDAEALSDAHLRAAGVRPNAPVEGLAADGALAGAVFGNCPHLNRPAVEAEMIACARRLVERAPGLGAILLECTNMGPYAEAVSRAEGIPVYSVVDAVEAAIMAEEGAG